jgi:5'-nucleotidase
MPRMIRTIRFHVVFLIPLGLGMVLSACDSSSDGGSGTLRILVTNDDGVGAPGIDVLVEALIADPNNEVVVSAPAENRSGSGDSTIDEVPSCGSGEAASSSTASGYDDDVWAVDGCPADAVIYALENLYPEAPPHVVLSGINEGQNVGNVNGLLSQISGTVGAAKTAACADIPAMASSQGEGETLDYESGVTEVLRWLEENREALLAGDVAVDNITSINIPSCDTGAIRGQLEVPLALDNPNGWKLREDFQDCESTVEDPPNDIEAFFNGYTAITPVPRNTTCPNK